MGNRADSGANDAAQQTVSTLALTDEERTAYLKACGWEVDAASCTVREVIIPSDFDESLSELMQDLQARQGFDLENSKANASSRSFTPSQIRKNRMFWRNC